MVLSERFSVNNLNGKCYNIVMEERKYSILVVDDEEAITDMYSHALSHVGYDVSVAYDGKDAWEKIKLMHGHEIDMILLDIIMPKMDGFDLLEKLRKHAEFKHVKVIMLTNLNRPEDEAEAKKLGADDFFIKVKTSPHQLVLKVNEFFGKNLNEHE